VVGDRGWGTGGGRRGRQGRECWGEAEGGGGGRWERGRRLERGCNWKFCRSMHIKHGHRLHIKHGHRLHIELRLVDHVTKIPAACIKVLFPKLYSSFAERRSSLLPNPHVYLRYKVKQQDLWG